jgi:hypothetical protein
MNYYLFIIGDTLLDISLFICLVSFILFSHSLFSSNFVLVIRFIVVFLLFLPVGPSGHAV